MATRPFPTPRSRPLALGPALALALLLLLAQHWGLVHGLGHSLAGRDAAVLSAAAGHAQPAVAAVVAGDATPAEAIDGVRRAWARALAAGPR